MCLFTFPRAGIDLRGHNPQLLIFLRADSIDNMTNITSNRTEDKITEYIFQIKYNDFVCLHPLSLTLTTDLKKVFKTHYQIKGICLDIESNISYIFQETKPSNHFTDQTRSYKLFVYINNKVTFAIKYVKIIRILFICIAKLQ